MQIFRIKTAKSDLYKKLLKSLWKILEENGRKWKIIPIFADDSVKE